VERYLKAWYKNQYANLLDVLKHDDVTVMAEIIQDAQGKSGGGDREDYARRILERAHHHVVYETGSHADANDVRVSIEVDKKLRQKYTDIDFILDLGARGTVHKFHVKGDERLGDEFPIYDTVSNRYSRLSEESSILEKISRSFHVVRIYADVPKSDLPEYREQATQIEQAERRAI
jgi:hypothetical protein